MSALQKPPGEGDLLRLYHELARLGAPSVGRREPWQYGENLRPEALLVLASGLSRYDARLLTILVQWLVAQWGTLNPLECRKEMHQMPWPQAVCVVLTFTEEALGDPEFRYFADYIRAGWARVEPPERFLINGERPGSRMASLRSGRNLRAYTAWGFVGSERPLANAVTKQALGSYDATTRLMLLKSLAERRKEFTVSDYLEAVDGTISRQQALRDLHAAPFVRLHGHGRGARWKYKNR